jgi:protein ImuB
VRTVAERQVVVDVSPGAAALHVRRGMTLTEARSLCAALPFVEQDALRDERALEALGRWMMRFSPVVALSGRGGSPVALPEKRKPGRAARATSEHHALFLDVTGCERLFDGLGNIMAQARRALAGMGIAARLAIAPTPGAAWALASAGDEIGLIVEDEREVEDFLAPLPPIALRIDDDVADALHHLGLETIGQVLQLPREALPARFGHALGMRIDQALGRIPEPLVPLEPVEEITAKMEFDGTIDSLEAIWAVFNDLLPRVLAQLERRGHGLRQLDVDFLQHYAPPVRKSIQLSRPSRDPVNVFNLFRTAVEGAFGRSDGATERRSDGGRKTKRLSPSSLRRFVVSSLAPAGFSGLRLTAAVHERMTGEQVRLFDGETYAGQLEFDRLVERLCARLGDKAVARPKLFESYLPERAWREGDKVTGRQGDKVRKKRTQTKSASLSPSHPLTLSPPHAFPTRPLHLFPAPQEIRVLAEPCDDCEGRPRQFSRRGGPVHRLVAAVGPERIAGEWWRGHDKTRDYYDVADEAGRRFWVFRVVTRRVLKTEAGPEVHASARWFCHGVFE